MSAMPQLILWPPPWKQTFPGAYFLTVAYLLLIVVPITALVSVLIVLFVKPYEYFFSRNDAPRMTAKQVAAIIDQAASDEVDDDVWDDFACVPMNDVRLDAAVKRAVEIVEIDRPSGKITPEDAQRQLRLLAFALRGPDV
jgi:hypothetical protein